MKFLFIQPEFENIGLEYLSSIIKNIGHEVELVFLPMAFSNTSFQLKKEDEDSENKIIYERISEYNPDIVCFSPFTSYFKWSVEKAKYIKEMFSNIFVLYGGVHATFIPEETIKEEVIDALIVGEGEKSVTEFVNNFYDREKLVKTPGLWIKYNGIVVKNPLPELVKNLDELPYPDKDLFYKYFPNFQKKDTFTIMTARGCPYKCTYCCNDIYNEMYKGQKAVRYQSPKYVIEQLKYFKDKYKFKRVDFMDDVFATTYKRLEELLPTYKKEIGLPFVCFMYPNNFTVKDEVLQILKENGCEWVKIGVQSANEDYRKTILKRKESNEMIIKISDMCHKYKILFSFDHILEMPGETLEDLVEAIKLYNRCKPAIINFGSLIYLPKTKIVNFAIEKGVLTENDALMINKGEEKMALASNIGRFQGHSSEINYSIITLMFILVTLLPASTIDYLLKKEIYKSKRKVPSIVLIIIKVISKIKAKQGYIYFSAVKYSIYYIMKGLFKK